MDALLRHTHRKRDHLRAPFAFPFPGEIINVCSSRIPLSHHGGGVVQRRSQLHGFLRFPFLLARPSTFCSPRIPFSHHGGGGPACVAAARFSLAVSFCLVRTPSCSLHIPFFCHGGVVQLEIPLCGLSSPSRALAKDRIMLHALGRLSCTYMYQIRSKFVHHQCHHRRPFAVSLSLSLSLFFPFDKTNHQKCIDRQLCATRLAHHHSTAEAA
jgi:hypothetical protein